MQPMLRGCEGVFRVCRVFCVCQTRLKLSLGVDECKPLPLCAATRLCSNPPCGGTT